MKKITNIPYTMEDPTEDYQKAIRSAKNKGELVKAILPFKIMADDALACAKKLTDSDFKDFVKDIVKAKKCTDPTWCEGFIKRFGLIAMPYKMVISSLLADSSKAPWGCAFNRCEELGWKKIFNQHD